MAETGHADDEAPARPALSSGSRSYVIPSTAGHTSAPPMPISARIAISIPTFTDNPASSENPANMAAPMKNIRLRPNRSARRPAVTMSTPKTTV